MNRLARSAVRLSLMLIALFVFGAPAQADDQNSISGLSVSTGNGVTIIKVKLTQPLARLPASFTINTPPRIVFDFPNTANGLGKSVQEFSEGNLRSANIVQAGNRTRLVVNLDQMLTYDSKLDGKNLLLTLHNKSADMVASKTSRFAEAKEGAQQHELRDIAFHRGKNGEGRIEVDLSDPGIGIDIKQQGTLLIVNFLKTSLPRNLQRKLDVVDFATPVQDVDTYAQGDNVRMVIAPTGNWEDSAYQTDNKFIVEVRPVTANPDKLAQGGTGYKGAKLTLNFQKIDVREALNVIADFTGTNMVISDTVSGNITLRLKDVPWDQALDIILQSRGLAMRKIGNVIQVAPSAEIAAKEKLELTSHQEISELQDLRTESFQISYQKADAIATLLSSDKQRILSKRGSAVVDARTNTLFVQDTPDRLDEVRKLIKQIDVPVRQVMIEARIVEATDNFSKNLGVRLGYNSNDAFSVGNSSRLFGNIGANSVVGGPLAGTTMPANTPNVNLPSAGTAGTFSMLLFNSAASKLLSVELTALETDSKGKIISSPRVVTSDQTEATIATGTEIPYQQASSSGATNVAFKSATLSLSVKPQITPDDNIIMDIKVNKDSVGALYAGVPSINTNSVTTQVLVENGGTVVIGGVYLQQQSNGVNKVPLLGDIPVLGYLFRSTAKLDNKSELLVFITPKIIKDAMSLR
ncbi:MAG TPA: type IV pilus secretin PilQ [Gallionella sp.]|nr:type IV pilus secretin PilQ [Gallionella sp.]